MPVIRWFKAWIVPGAVFQSVIVGGGYGTGREVVEYVSSAGPWGGLANTVLIGVLFGVVLAVTFDYARRFEVRDYRLFIKSLLGTGWMLYEAVMIVAFVLVLAVAGSAAGQVLQDSFGISFAAGVGLMLAIVVTFNYIGREWIERTLTAWGLLMSVLLIVYTVLVFRYQGGSIAAALAAAELEPGWWRSGVRFFLYTAMIIPVLLYATDHIETRAQAWGAGLIGGVLGTAAGGAVSPHLPGGLPGNPERSAAHLLDAPAAGSARGRRGVRDRPVRHHRPDGGGHPAGHQRAAGRLVAGTGAAGA